MVEFIPISSMGRASMMNSISIAMALLMISTIRDSGSLLTNFEYKRHAKSQWSPSSRLISSLLKHKPGIKPRFFNQKIAQKEPEKKIAFIQQSWQIDCFVFTFNVGWAVSQQVSQHAMI